ncbi:hypothetical protein [Streptomyces sp. NPDC003720]|uniref:hypothetical protein n=1 Tax=Streptomyces sp. NPDC003720 TaxID=3364684 RepID=UPI003692FB0A
MTRHELTPPRESMTGSAAHACGVGLREGGQVWMSGGQRGRGADQNGRAAVE